MIRVSGRLLAIALLGSLAVMLPRCGSGDGEPTHSATGGTSDASTGGVGASASGGSAGIDSGATGGMAGASSSDAGDAAGAAGSGGGDAGADADAGACAPNQGTVLAIQSLVFGEGNSGQWKAVGFDLDGKSSTATSSDLCQPNSGASPSTPYPDGNQGIDNSFGKNLLPLLLALNPTWVSDVNGAITNGEFTALMKLVCLPPTGDVPVLVTKLFDATSLGAAPKWDGTDAWPVRPELLSNTSDPESSQLVFSNGSVQGSSFDAGPNGTFVLSIPMQTSTGKTELVLTLHAAHVTMQLGANRTSATAGMIGGVLDTEEFVAEVKKLGAVLDLCGTTLFDSLLTQIRQASDIMADGTQSTSSTCNGISIGIGFTMQSATLGGVGPATPTGSTCP